MITSDFHYLIVTCFMDIMSAKCFGEKKNVLSSQQLACSQLRSILSKIKYPTLAKIK